MRFVRKLIMGVSHAAVQLIAGTLAMLLAVKVAGCFEWRGHLFNVMVVSGTALFGAIASGVVLGAYLMTWSLLPKVGTHDNEAFSALRSTKRKNFLRMQITGDGLDVHVLAVDKICRHWERGPEGELPR